MKTTRPITVIVALTALAALAADASAYYHPTVGRFISRDPGSGRNSSSPAATTHFPPRDPTGSNQYADGMNLYEYVRSNPVGYVDPMGLAATKTGTQSAKKRTLSEKELMGMKDDAARRDAIKSKRGDRLEFFKQELKKLCTNESAKKATPKRAVKKEDCCTKEKCKKEADAIAEAYNAMSEKYAYHPNSWGLQTRPPAQDSAKWDVVAGWQCHHWARFTWEAMQEVKKKKVKCWRFARAGAVEWVRLRDPSDRKKTLEKKMLAGIYGDYMRKKPNLEYTFEIKHNWVTATVGQKVAADGEYTVRLDPWSPKRQFIYTQKNHGKYNSGYIARRAGETRDRFLLDIRSINPPKGKHDGPSAIFRNHYYRFGDIWPKGTATVGLEK